jgi:leucyl-tRNA synthetase
MPRERSTKTLGEAVRTVIKLMSPFAPHVSEELWEKTGGKGLVSVSEWPKARKPDRKAIEIENVMRRLNDDTGHVLKLAGIKAKEIRLMVAPEWKRVFSARLAGELKKTRNPGEIIKSLMSEPKLKPYGKDIRRMVPALLKNPEKIPVVSLTPKEEHEVLSELAPSLEEEFGCRITVEFAEKSKSPKAKQAMPGRPGIEVS